jgi:hypothetical protein
MRSPTFRPGVEECERRETVADLLSAVGLAAAQAAGLTSEQAHHLLFHLPGSLTAPVTSR